MFGVFSKAKKAGSLYLVGMLAVSLWSGIDAANAQGIQSGPRSSQQGVATPVEEQTDNQATIEFNKGVELFQIAQVQSEKGNLSGQRELLRESIRRFEAALRVDPKLAEAQSNIGFAYLTLKDYRRAILNFEKVLTINPQHLNTLNGLSTAYAFDGKIDQAIQTFDRLTTLDPANSQYFFNKGSVLQKAGRVAAAKVAYEQALRIQPTDQRTLFNLGTLFENQGNLLEAQKYYEKAKGVEIGNTIGLESIRRLEAIQAATGGGNSGQ